MTDLEKKNTAENDKTASTSIPKNRQLITEGSISMLYPKDVVFYNPVQVQNRDLSLIMIKLYTERYYKSILMNMKKKELVNDVKRERKRNQENNTNANGNGKGKDSNGNIGQQSDIDLKMKEFEASMDWKQLFATIGSTTTTNLPKNHSNIKGVRILDALAASGLRSLRYYKELNNDLVHSISINDLDPAAIDLAKENIEYNHLSHALMKDDDNDNDKGKEKEKKTKIYMHNEDATQLMYMSKRKPNRYSNYPSTTPTSSNSKLPLFDQYDVIDLDPYGSVAPFLDSALQSIADGGMLAITSTDMKTLGGTQTDTCYARYGSMPINKSKYLQELALRILLCDIAKRAAVYGRSIKPILSVGMNFYVRVFVEVYSHGPTVKNLSTKIGTVYQSAQCPSYHVVPHGQCSSKNVNVIQAARAPLIEKCSETGCSFKTAGPIWLGPLHDDDVVKEAINRLEALMVVDNNVKEEGNEKKKEKDNTDPDTIMKEETKDMEEERRKKNDNRKGTSTKEFQYLKMGKELHGLLTMASEELNDVPLYYILPDLCHTLGCSTPPLKKFKAAIINAGYRVSGYHKEPQAIKTNAPNNVVWDILRVWCKENPPKKNSKKREKKKNKRRKNNENINQDENKKLENNGTENDGSEAVKEPPMISTGEQILAIEPIIEVNFTIPDELKVKKKVCRFPKNPQAHWGPKKAATGYKRKAEEE